MSTIQVDRIIPYSSASVTIEGDVIQANAATTGSNTFVGDQNIQGTITASIQEGFALVGGAGDVSVLVATSSFGGVVDTSSLATTGSNSFVGNQEITGSATITGTLTVPNDTIFGKDLILNDPGATTIMLLNPDYFSEFKGGFVRWQEGLETSHIQLAEREAQILMNGFSSSYDNGFIATVDANGLKFEDWNPGAGYATSEWLQVPQLGTPSIKRGLEVTGSLLVSSSADQQIKFNVATGFKEFLIDNTTSEFYTFNDTIGNIKKSDGQGIILSHQYGLDMYNVSFTKDIGFALDMNTAAGTGTNKSGIWGVGSGGGYYDFISFEDSTNWTDGRIQIHRTLQVDKVLQLQPQDPLPTGALGQLAVSGSDLYFHNGSTWVVK